MSTRPDTPSAHNDVDPYAPRWVRDPSYQVLRRAETLKRTVLSPEETEPAPSVPCAEPDLRPNFPEFLSKKRQTSEDELYIDNIRVPPSLRPRRPFGQDEAPEPWPHRRPTSTPIVRKALHFTLAASAIVGGSYLITWKSSDTPAAVTGVPVVRASVTPVNSSPVAPPVHSSPTTHSAPTRLKTIRITPKPEEPWPDAATGAETAAPAPKYQLAAVWQQMPSSAPAPVAASPWPSETPKPAAAATDTPAVAASPPAIELDAETVALLIKRGEQFISAGDFASARVVLRRAAESGNREAALAMAGTYDPAALKRLGVKGLAPDPEKARFWYEKARQLGSTKASQLIKQLAKRTE